MHPPTLGRALKTAGMGGRVLPGDGLGSCGASWASQHPLMMGQADLCPCGGVFRQADSKQNQKSVNSKFHGDRAQI